MCLLVGLVWLVVQVSSAFAEEGADFAAEADYLYRVAACADSAPPGADEKVVTAHCKRLQKSLTRYRDVYLAKAGPFFAGIRPTELPDVVVYPFGGGDLLSALTVFPAAQEITTISLEAAGDPRPVTSLKRHQLRKGLLAVRETAKSLLIGRWNWSKRLDEAERARLPSQVVFAMLALAIHGREPISLRYFTLDRDGAIHYLDATEIAALQARRRPRVNPFAHVELRFRTRGDPSAPVVTFRHIRFNLDDAHLKANPALLAHLKRKGRVAAMTRAAVYLLWSADFSLIREYLLDNMEWMVSDSTGIPPPLAEKAGFEQIPYGRFSGAYRPPDMEPSRSRRYDRHFKALWKRHPRQPLEFWFGYPDRQRRSHLIVTRKASK